MINEGVQIRRQEGDPLPTSTDLAGYGFPDTAAA